MSLAMKARVWPSDEADWDLALRAEAIEVMMPRPRSLATEMALADPDFRRYHGRISC